MHKNNQLAVNDIIDQYRVVKRLAASENAQVYLVYSEVLATQLALKIDTSSLTVAPNKTANSHGLDSHTHHFTSQAKLLFALDDAQNIVSVMHTGIYEDKLERFESGLNHEAAGADDKLEAQKKNTPTKMAFFVMPYYEQCVADLLSINGGKLGLKQAIACLRDSLIALNYLHKNAVIHCDIKPENIFVDTHSRFVVGDLDNAQILANSPLSDRVKVDSKNGKESNLAMAGSSEFIRVSPQFASPEQMRSPQHVSAVSDIYSLGRVIIRVLVGTLDVELTKTAKDLSKNEASLQKQRMDLLDENHVPAWLQTLLIQMTQFNVEDRISSAQECLDIIAANVYETEHEHTQVLPVDSLYSSNTLKLRDEIKALLLTHGRVVKVQREVLQSLYFSETNLAQQDQHDLLQLQIEEVKQQITSLYSLTQWFAWVKYLEEKQEKEGNRLSSEQYQQQLSIGRTTRPDNPNAADVVLSDMFASTTSTRFAMKSVNKVRYILPLFLITAVYVYWGLDIHSLFLQKNETTNFSQIKDNNTTESEDNVPASQTQSGPNEKTLALTQSDSAQSAALNAKPTLQSKSNNQASANTTNVVETNIPGYTLVELNHVDGKAVFWRHTLIANQASAANFDSQPVQTSFYTIRVNNDFSVMQHEVTQALYQLCIDEGICRRTKRFSTSSAVSPKTLKNTRQHPMVNVSWFDISQGFIPWLNQRTNKQFLLPRLQQWRLFASHAETLSIINRTSHCKYCDNAISLSIASGTVDVTALPANNAGLFGVRGNAQEWLFDCAVSNQIERCDQALVIGGSWLDNRDTLQGDRPSVLLKRASTPTTGFRLIEQLND
jgi:serine/threonine protein kinase